MIYITLDEIKRRKKKNLRIAEPPVVKLLRAALDRGETMAEDKILCQPPCQASRKEIFKSINELIEFHRASRQYPLNKYWLQLELSDEVAGMVIATISYPEADEEGGQERRDNRVSKGKLVWVLRKNLKGEMEVQLEWTTLSDFFSKHKHKVVLAIAGYTEECLRKLNEFDPNKQSRKELGLRRAIAIDRDPAEMARLAEEAANWPTAQDYNEAVQNPQICFTDSSLQEGVAEQNMLGVPRAISGAFASVYHILGNEQEFAVRCFLNPVRDQHLRYSILKKHLANESCKSIVDFEFVQQGIKIGSRSFPILKMEWIKGLGLASYIEKHLENKEKISTLRNEFKSMVCGLRNSKIAHGDLQHGNVIVKDNDEIVLVDYDGIFVPALVKFHSAELGHPNYQHPRRADKHFGLFLDNFAGWLIDTSLLCLEEDPSLWQQFDGGDECILFRRKDLQRPKDSRLFGVLQTHSSERVRESCTQFLSLLKLELEEIPFLDHDQKSGTANLEA